MQIYAIIYIVVCRLSGLFAVGAKSEAVSQPREQSSLLVEQKHVTSWADEVEEADGEASSRLSDETLSLVIAARANSITGQPEHTCTSEYSNFWLVTNSPQTLLIKVMDPLVTV